MKKVLPLFLFFASLSFLGKVNAQSCSVANPTVSNISVNSSGGSCTVTFDLSFDFGGNPGNKWKAIYIWTESAYSSIPSSFYGSNGTKAPSSTDLNNSNALATISINDAVSTSQTLSSYPNDVTNPTSFKPGLAYSATATTLTVKGISVSVANCSSQIKLKADVGATNSNSFSQFGCISKGELSFTANEPITRGLNVGCGSTRQIAATFITTQATTVNFGLFKDVAPLGQFTAADTAAANLVGGPFSTSTSLNSSTNDYRSVGSYNYNVKPGEKFDVWVVAYAQNVSNVVVQLVTNSCSNLPVVFQSVSATRNDKVVSVKWQTSFEQNNKGFYIQRNTNGEWKDIAFVFSGANGGNSSQVLSYAYNDPNTFSGVSYYRILQVDIDGQGRYSEVLIVKGQKTASQLLLFPNPGTNGRMNLQFSDETAPKNILVYDATGRMIRAVKNYTGSLLSIDRLKPGMYNVQVTNVESLLTVSDKFIIQN